MCYCNIVDIRRLFWRNVPDSLIKGHSGSREFLFDWSPDPRRLTGFWGVFWNSRSRGRFDQIERHKKGVGARLVLLHKANSIRFSLDFFNDEHRPFSGLLTLHSVNGS